MASKRIEMKSSKDNFAKDPTEVEVYLKHQIGQMNVHKNKILEKISELYDINRDGFYLRQELNRRNEQLFEIKNSVSDLQVIVNFSFDYNFVFVNFILTDIYGNGRVVSPLAPGSLSLASLFGTYSGLF